MKTDWKWSLELEAQRVAYVARNIAKGFYEVNGFTVLPSKYLKNDLDIVVFPDINVKRIPNFWSRVKDLNIGNWQDIKDKELLKDIRYLILDIRLKKPEIKKLQNTWKLAEAAVIKEVERVLNKPSSIRSISIYPSNFGLSVSYNVTNKLPADIELFLRFDQNIHTIAEGIISSLIHNDLLFELKGSFRDKEFIIDWLVKESSISRFLQKYEKIEKFVPTTKSISKKERSKLNEISRKFLHKLGCPDVKKVNFFIKTGIPYFNSKPIRNLTWQERRILCIFIENLSSIVDFDAIGQTIFRQEKDYSLWAMAKFIQRLREKLEVNGISGDHIQTVRKRGYLLR